MCVINAISNITWPNWLWQDTSEKHYSCNNRGERSLCGVVLNKLTRPFTAFDTGLAASHNGRHINLQMPSGKLKCQRFSQQHPASARGIIDWFTFCLHQIFIQQDKKEAKQKMKEYLLQCRHSSGSCFQCSCDQYVSSRLLAWDSLRATCWLVTPPVLTTGWCCRIG